MIAFSSAIKLRTCVLSGPVCDSGYHSDFPMLPTKLQRSLTCWYANWQLVQCLLTMIPPCLPTLSHRNLKVPCHSVSVGETGWWLRNHTLYGCWLTSITANNRDLLEMTAAATSTYHPPPSPRPRICSTMENEWENEKIYIARLKAYKCMLNLPRLTEN